MTKPPERIIRTAKHVTITEAHPFHRYLSDYRDQGGVAVVEKAFDERCPLCRQEAKSDKDEL
jgi:hypothetical protein